MVFVIFTSETDISETAVSENNIKNETLKL